MKRKPFALKAKGNVASMRSTTQVQPVSYDVNTTDFIDGL